MKKTFFILIVAITWVMNVSAQIAVNKVNDNGSHIIITDEKNLYRGAWHGVANWHIGYIITKDSLEIYSFEMLLNEGEICIDKGRKMLFKSESGKIFTLENTKEIRPIDYEYTRYGVFTYPSYTVTEEDIKNLINEKIVKVRIETNTGYIDKDLKPKKFKQNLEEMYNALKEAKQKAAGVYDGF